MDVDTHEADRDPTFARPTSWSAFVRLLFPSKGVAFALLLVAVVLPTVLVIQQIRHNYPLSQYDEFAHYDYVEKVGRGTIPRTGQHVDAATLRVMACHKIDYPGLDLPACDAPNLPFARFPGDAFNHEAQQPPLYYAATAAYRSVVQHTIGIDDPLTASRTSGVVWLVLALLATWTAGRLLGASAWAMLAALLVLAVSPAAIYFSSIVSNDATALLTGAAFVIAAVVLGRDPTLLATTGLFVIGFAGAWLKPTNAFAAATVALFFLVLAYQDRHDRSLGDIVRRWLRATGMLAVGAAVGVVLWIVISNALAFVDARDLPIFAVRRLDGLHVDLFLAQASYLLNAPTGLIPSTTLTQPIQLFTSEVIRDLFVAVAFVGLFAARRAWYHVLGLTAVVVLLAGGFVFGAAIWVSLRMDPGVVPRYGLSVLPLLAVCLARLAQRGRVVWLVGAIGVFTAVTTLWTLA